MKLWILLCFAIGVATSARLRRYSPHRAVHVLFMHHEPVHNNSLNTTDNFNACRSHAFRGFYQHFLNFLMDDSLRFDDYDTTENYKSPQDPWVQFINPGNASKLNSSMMANKTDSTWAMMTTVASNETLVTLSNSTDSKNIQYDVNDDSQNSTGGEHRIKRVRREFTNYTETRVVTNQSNGTNTTANTTNENVPVVNFSKETLDDDFTTSVEKMIANIDQQLENKSQAILKRIKRVGENADNNFVKTIEKNVSIPEAKNITPATQSKEANNTNGSSIGPVNTSTTQALVLSTLSSNSSTSNRSESKTELDLIPPPVQPHFFNITNSSDLAATVDSKNSSVSIMISNTTETTQREQEIFQVPDGMSEEETDLGTPSEPSTDSNVDEIDNEEKKQNGVFRKMVETDVPMIVNSDIEINRNMDNMQNGDIIKALIVPVFLVVLMGSLLFAVHNMSRYLAQGTNVRRPANSEVMQMQVTTTNPMAAANASTVETVNKSGPSPLVTEP